MLKLDLEVMTIIFNDFQFIYTRRKEKIYLHEEIRDLKKKNYHL